MARVVERFSLNPNWVGTKTLYLVQKVIKRCLMIVSKTLFKVERIDIGRYFFNSELEPPLCKGMTRAIFSSSGYSPLFRQELKILLRKGARENLAALINFVGISSSPGALLGSIC